MQHSGTPAKQRFFPAVDQSTAFSSATSWGSPRVPALFAVKEGFHWIESLNRSSCYVGAYWEQQLASHFLSSVFPSAETPSIAGTCLLPSSLSLISPLQWLILLGITWSSHTQGRRLVPPSLALPQMYTHVLWVSCVGLSSWPSPCIHMGGMHECMCVCKEASEGF